ncbi:prepilin-type N-terminal cleavage/methylation domain-containing protein, partial [bacterium]|nr:prepilin-type N-terminal cleavage/methylation domain-containing protein [bacterium]
MRGHGRGFTLIELLVV